MMGITIWIGRLRAELDPPQTSRLTSARIRGRLDSPGAMRAAVRTRALARAGWRAWTRRASASIACAARTE